jgi:Zn finger protein HypA/HybF involved in hydrogenase expression
MHEMSLALEVCDIAQRYAPPGCADRVVEVGVEVGEAAGVEPDNLEFWLETLLSSPPFKAARPVIKRVPGNDLRVSYLEVDDGRPND